MAAPSGTTWGSAVSGTGNNGGRIGIYLTTSTTSTQVKAAVQVWFWSKYGVHDENNTFRADWASLASTSRGSRSIYTNVSSGTGWSTSNQVKIAEYSKTYTKSGSAQTGRFAASLTGIEALSGTMTASVSFTIAANATYTVSYNANGGSGAPKSQTKQQGVTLKLSSTKPSRDGFVFIGWGTSSGDRTPDYQPGSSYTANASITLYAIWESESQQEYCYVKYNANGGSEEPTFVRVAKGSSTNIASTAPIRTRHTFLGWSTNKTATSASYSLGQSVTLNNSLYLYAVWRLNDSTIKLHDDGKLEVTDIVESSGFKISEGKIQCSDIIESSDITLGNTLNISEIVEI